MGGAVDTGAIPDANDAPHSRRFGRYLDVALLLGTAYALFLVLTFSYGRDQGIYAVVARTILDGGMPYRDAWDFKPPGIYVIYAAVRAVWGSSQTGIRILEVLGLALMARGLVLLASRWWGQPRIGLLAAALACLVHAQLDFWHTAQPESFGGMLTIWGLVVGTGPAAGRGRVWRYIAAGVLFGCAGLLKPPLAGAGAVLALAAAVQPWVDARRARTSEKAPLPVPRLCARACVPIGAVLLGGVLPFVACLGWFAAKGALGSLYETLFVFTPHYTALGWEGRNILGLFYQAAAQWLVSYSSWFAIGLLLLVAAGPRWWRLRGVGLLVAVIAVQLLGVALQGKFFPYHYAATWPVTALLVALGWWQLWQRATRRGALGASLFVFVFVVVGVMRTATKDLDESFWARAAERTAIFLAGQRDAERIDALASVADVDAAGNREVAELIRARVPPQRSVYIWGFEPVIYDLADRQPASHYLYNVPQRVPWSAAPSRAALMQELRARPPAAVVVAHHDLIPMVTGDYLDSASVLDDFTALDQLVFDQYQWAARVQDFDVYLARAAP